MDQQELIKNGVEMFQQICYESTSYKDENGQINWSGKVCEGGGSFTKHILNQDLMTPWYVVDQLGHHSCRTALKKHYEEFKHSREQLCLGIFNECKIQESEKLGLIAYEEAKKGGLTDKDRWGDDISHHPKSIKLMTFLQEHDRKDYGDSFCWSLGGDGDRKTLMYQMDAFFELEDITNQE